MHEVRSIPPAPRRIRLGPVLAHRWPLLAIGGSLVVLGSLFAWLMFLSGSPDQRLDTGPAAGVTGVVDSCEPPVTIDGVAMERVRYTFTWREAKRHGLSFATAGRFTAGERVQVQVLATDDNVNRITGTRMQQERMWLRAPFWLLTMAVPGLLVLIGWLAGFLLLRRVLVHGDATVGRILAIREVGHVLPEMLRVTYEFRDHRATVRQGSHWVRLHGALGARLLRQLRAEKFDSLPVLHDRRVPRWNRLILPADFLEQPAHGALRARNADA